MKRTALVLLLAVARLGLLLAVGAPAPAARPGSSSSAGATARRRPWPASSRGPGEASARILVVPWASGEPKESCEAILGELAAHAPGEAAAGRTRRSTRRGRRPPAGRDATEEGRRSHALARSTTGVFFTGGDQARIMDVLADPELLAAVKARFAAGVVFGGTSAGAAVMSARMITGEGDFTVIDGDKVEVRPGLGLLEGVIVDQHFVKRQRENRLFGLVLKHPEERGVGIDEDTALLVTRGPLRGGRGEGAGDAGGRDRAPTAWRSRCCGRVRRRTCGNGLDTHDRHEPRTRGRSGGALRAPQEQRKQEKP